ncbi:hypothetical protein [Aureimonas leprariae]|uniref:Contractile injection system tube protein N-terminal domain-containing protein n=1 Tax=Plantimonas leprariae TaxID=2615207 RepID=A0A7V7PRE5_9HYPH|nr:hypothetical protein [Aureimonas leprariae]KAB0681334.1 hypothetical protein F6X38_05465 [Aureimonas leprariae]
MERIAFLVEKTGEQIFCLLNPETVVVRRSAGLRGRRLASGAVTGLALTDDPLIATGGGTTEIDLDLLFDIDLDQDLKRRAAEAATDASVAAPPFDLELADVRNLTRPVWNLAENGEGFDGFGAPPAVRLIWGRAWNIPGVVISVAEKFERFAPDGRPQRSWLRLRLRRVDSEKAASPAPLSATTQFELPLPDAVGRDGEARSTGVTLMPDEFGIPSPRIDEIVAGHYGDLGPLAAVLAFNEIEDPLNVAEGQVLILPEFPVALP